MKKENWLLEYNSGRVEIHYPSAVGPEDYALCGQDLSGDEDYESAIKVFGKVTCNNCLEIVKFCKSLKPLKKAKA